MLKPVFLLLHHSNRCTSSRAPLVLRLRSWMRYCCSHNFRTALSLGRREMSAAQLHPIAHCEQDCPCHEAVVTAEAIYVFMVVVVKQPCPAFSQFRNQYLRLDLTHAQWPCLFASTPLLVPGC